MVETQPYRFTRPVPLVRLELFCCALQQALAAAYASADLERFWRLYVSAECPVCGIQICGDELRSLAFPPSAELASAKIGRMRLGDCARRGCGAWHYSVHLWNPGEIDWASLMAAAATAERAIGTSRNAPGPYWLTLLGSTASYATRVAAILAAVFVLWLARELYLGGRIPYLREPEKFKTDTTPLDNTWPAPMDGTEAPIQ